MQKLTIISDKESHYRSRRSLSPVVSLLTESLKICRR